MCKLHEITIPSLQQIYTYTYQTILSKNYNNAVNLNSYYVLIDFIIINKIQIVFDFVFFSDSFDLGYDIQQYFALHQNLFLEDLARTNSRHTLNGLMRVVSKVSSFSIIYLINVCHLSISITSTSSP